MNNRNILILIVLGMVLLAAAPAAQAGLHCLPIIVEDPKLIKPEQLKPNATFHISVPVLGKDTHRTRGHPTDVAMSVHLPENYDPKRAHPVIVHLGGGQDERKFVGRWQSITGNKDFIVMLAGFTSMLTSGPRNASQMVRVLEAATPIKHGAVILAGISSGSWGMHGNFRPQFYDRGYVDTFDAFIFIAGDNERDVIVTKDKLRGRPALFVGGNTGGAFAIQKKTSEEIAAAGGDATFIPMMHHYSDFSRDVDPKIMDWIKTKVLARQDKYDAFDKKLSAATKGDDYIDLLKDALPHWYGKCVAMTKYLTMAQQESDAGKRSAMLAKLKDIPNLPKTTGGQYQEALKWLKTQSGYEALVKTLALCNPFLDPIPGYFNGYAPGTNFRTR
ncbi:MAG: hypothetical protein LLG01_12120 [Planctomycetaceae bacterium]|nr:hypothetical protein [Planctomycetaceae bacterium]